MNLLLACLLSAGGVYAMLRLLLHAANGFKTALLPAGKSEDSESRNNYSSRVKIFENKPMQNINTTENVNNNYTTRIPNMRGVNNGNDLPAVRTNAPVMGGVANAIGGISQNGAVKNNFRARHQITGPIYQGGAKIYNNKFNGNRLVSQNAQSIKNKDTFGKTIMNQMANAKNTINRGKTAINQMSGAINDIYRGRISFNSGNNYFYSKKMKIKGISQAQTLMTHKLYGLKGTTAMIRALAYPETRKELPGIEREKYIAESVPQNINNENQYIGFNLNDINMQRVNNFNRERYAISSQQDSTVIAMQNVLAGKEGLTTTEKTQYYSISKVREQTKIDERPEEGGVFNRNEAFNELLSTAVQIMPKLTNGKQLNNNQMQNIVDNAVQLRAERRQNDVAAAKEKTEEKIDVNKTNRETLNGFLKNSAGASESIKKYIDENFNDSNINNLSEAEIKDYENKAWESIKDREDMTLEEKEEELKNMVKEEKGSLEKDDIEEIVKDRILENPEVAKDILGEKNASELNEMLNKNQENYNKAFTQEMIKQDVAKHSDFLKTHPEYKKKSYYEAYKARRQEEDVQDVVMAASQLYSSRNNNGENNRRHVIINNNVGNQMQPEQSKNEVNQPLQPQPLPRPIRMANTDINKHAMG